MIRVAIVGSGTIAALHLRAYLAFPDRCRIVALVDTFRDKALAMRTEYGLDDAVVLDSHEALCGLGGVDLVSICTPPFTHAGIAEDCMRAGIDVIVEKPMAASLEECDRIMAVERETGRTLSAVAQNRFRTPVMNLKKLLDQDRIGSILHVQADSLWWRGLCYYDLWWRGTWSREGGGCTLNHAVHHIDLINWMMGMPRQVVSVIANVAHDNAEVEDLSVSILRYERAVGQLTGSVVHHGESQQIVFQAEKARVSYPFDVYASTSRENGFPMRNEALEAEIRAAYEALPPLRHEGHTAQIDDVLGAIEAGRQPLITSQDGRNTIELITAIYKAGSTGLPADLPIRSDDPWYTTGGILRNAKHFYEKKKQVDRLDGEITV
ncbi:MAG: Gfo/Idh/MocA family oxidoreductase [Clostridia bacterium]|nr:Gfo/Idh/MocA family oxidoreductase [Clostridia bacterium]